MKMNFIFANIYSIPVVVDDEAEKSMRYFFEEKRIPPNLEEALLNDVDPPEVLYPNETTCPLCKSNLNKKSEKKAVVFGFGKVWHGECGKMYLVLQ